MENRNALPKWYVSPDAQIEWFKSFIARHEITDFSVDDIPDIPESYLSILGKSTEVLMLAIYLPDVGEMSGLDRTYHLMLSELEIQSNSVGWVFDASAFYGPVDPIYSLRLFNGYRYNPGVRWVAFDPNANAGMSVDVTKDLFREHRTSRLAGLEVVQAASLFPALRRSWCSRTKASRRRDVTPAPYLGGIEVDLYSHVSHEFYSDWDLIPVFMRSVRRFNPLDENRKLALDVVSCNGRSYWHSTPTVRDL